MLQMTRSRRHAAIAALLGVVAALAAAPSRASVYPETPDSRRAAEANRLEAEQRAARRAETVARIAAHLEVDNAPAGLVLPLLDIAADPTVSEDQRRQARRLLARAASHTDSATAQQAERALETLRRIAERPLRVETQAEEDARRHTRRQEELQKLMERLSDPESPHRGLAAQSLFTFATTTREVEANVYAFAGWMRRDDDSEVARWGEILTARVEGREPDPSLAPPHRLSAEELRRAADREQGLVEQASDPSPHRRRDALRQLAEIAQSENRTHNPKILRVFEYALEDPDSAVSGYARFMLKAFAGDRHALGMVYVRGESLP